MSERFCPSCGAPVAEGARFCGACGKALSQAPAAASRTPAAGEPEAEVYELRPLVVRTFGELLICILTAGLAWVVLALARMGLRYRVTTERIEVQEGVVNRTSRFIDLFRIEDFEVEEPFFLRIRGAGNLVVRSMDKDQPVATLHAIPDARSVFENLRSLTREERSRRGVRVIEGM